MALQASRAPSLPVYSQPEPGLSLFPREPLELLGVHILPSGEPWCSLPEDHLSLPQGSYKDRAIGEQSTEAIKPEASSDTIRISINSC